MGEGSMVAAIVRFPGLCCLHRLSPEFHRLPLKEVKPMNGLLFALHRLLFKRRGVSAVRRGAIVVVLFAALATLSVLSQAPTYVFSGHVYQGNPPDTSRPIAGATVELYGDQDEWPESGPKAFLAAGVTNEAGEFRLYWESRGVDYPYYHVIQMDPPGVASTGAQVGPPGYARNFNVVSYLDIPPGEYVGISFWDFHPGVVPPSEGWCCWNGEVFPSSEPGCLEPGGRFFFTEEEARGYCHPVTPREGWCCWNGEVFPSSEPGCLEPGGRFFFTEEEARDYCQPALPREQLPDLSIVEIGFDPEAPYPGQGVTITALIANVGSAPTEDILVLFMVDGRELAREVIRYLEPGGPEAVIGTWTATTPGDHTLLVEIDPEAWIKESNEENNTDEGVVTVARAIERLPDLVLTSEGIISSPEAPYVGDDVIISLTIRNEGNAPAEGVAVLLHADGIWEQRLDIGSIEAGGQEVIRIAETASSPGEYHVTVTVDPANRIAEWNEENNTASRSILAREENLPDLVVADIGLTPESPHAGEAALARAIVGNQGDSDAADFFVAFLVDDQKIGSRVISCLAPGEEEEVWITVAALSAGEHSIQVIADSDDWIRERDETNNKASTTLMVREAELPDLTIEDVHIHPQTPAPGEEVTITATILNQGTGPAEWVSIFLYVVGTGNAEATECRVDAPYADEVVEFAPGAEANSDFEDLSAVLGPPDFSEEPPQGFVSLGMGGLITLAFLDNFVINEPGPDLRIWGGPNEDDLLYVEVSDDGYRFESFGLVPQMADLDLADIGLESAVFVKIQDDGTQVQEGTASPGAELDAVEALHCKPHEVEWLFDDLELLESLEPGQRVVITTTWTAASPGPHTLIAEIDPLDSVRESDEANNKGERLLIVKEE